MSRVDVERARGRYSWQTIDDVVCAYRYDREKPKDIARRLGISYSSVWAWCRCHDPAKTGYMAWCERSGRTG